MEILNSVWSAITTENEFITNIIVSLATFIEAYLILSIFSLMLNLNTTKKQRFIYIMLFASVGIIINNTIPAPYNSILNIILEFTITKIIFKLPIAKTFIAMVVPVSLFSLIGTLILKPILMILNLPAEIGLHTPVCRLVYLISQYSIVLIILKVIQYFNIKLNIKENLNRKSRKIFLINMIVGIFTLCIELVITTFYIDTLPFTITMLSFFSLLSYFFISFYSLKKVMELQTTTENLKNAENYNNTLSILYDNVKGFKHDFDNMVFTIGGYISTNDIEGLKKYYKDLEKDCKMVNNISIFNPTIINNPGIYNLLMAKYKRADEKNIKINLESFFDFEQLHMPIYDLARMLGILLDNAIEAAEICDDKRINLTFRDSAKNHTQIITIENTYKNQDIDKTKIFEKGKTEKKDHMVMGLWEVKQILKRNNNVNLITNNDGVYFRQQLEIYY